MRDKKKETSAKTPEQEALERRVDAMMDPKLPDEQAAEPVPVAGSAVPAKPAKTAPALPDKLRKKIAVDHAQPEPISIDALDDLAKSITKPKSAHKPKKAPIAEEEPEEPEQAEDITEQSTDLDDNQTDKAVDDIVSHEGDVMLAVADATVAEQNRQANEAAGNSDKKGGFSTFVWFLVFVVAAIAIVLSVLLITGGNIPGIGSV